MKTAEEILNNNISNDHRGNTSQLQFCIKAIYKSMEEYAQQFIPSKLSNNPEGHETHIYQVTREGNKVTVHKDGKLINNESAQPPLYIPCKVIGDEKVVHDFIKNITERSVDLEPEIQRAVNKRFMDMLGDDQPKHSPPSVPATAGTSAEDSSSSEIPKCIEILKRHNRWRRGGGEDMTNPKILGQAIDTVIRHLESRPTGTSTDLNTDFITRMPDDKFDKICQEVWSDSGISNNSEKPDFEKMAEDAIKRLKFYDDYGIRFNPSQWVLSMLNSVHVEAAMKFWRDYHLPKGTGA